MEWPAIFVLGILAVAVANDVGQRVEEERAGVRLDLETSQRYRRPHQLVWQYIESSRRLRSVQRLDPPWKAPRRPSHA